MSFVYIIYKLIIVKEKLVMNIFYIGGKDKYKLVDFRVKLGMVILLVLNFFRVFVIICFIVCRYYNKCIIIIGIWFVNLYS